jgi:hypothetical protein
MKGSSEHIYAFRCAFAADNLSAEQPTTFSL